MIQNYNLIVTKYKSSSYVTNRITYLKENNVLYSIGFSIIHGIIYGFLSTLLDEIIDKNIIT